MFCYTRTPGQAGADRHSRWLKNQGAASTKQQGSKNTASQLSATQQPTAPSLNQGKASKGAGMNENTSAAQPELRTTTQQPASPSPAQGETTKVDFGKGYAWL
ncbi:uncharacterized protein LOC142558401 [Dermacentor variabilis]|uniref:uncharacterized protein LOC142558401 n=1 Tax=Dermacentor variabilis TaxID=34621 RepID=UPI003F5C497D